ncbi:hypothetical protein [Natronosalvus rutilus]|uniref:Uncharacterized protein n=1 Tax=Natronosalvus rutilus TaxID=2953753 RepID=A0A9E7N786_9EURY|nr:hypothetical protein [Natronosalvus rutilus]UTF52785.1 hypothetical protein NGM29_13460 [Natronosalvus rutilus]
MRGPETVDTSNTFTDLLESDKERFREQYKAEYNEISDGSALDLVESEFTNEIKPAFEVFKAVKDAFHPDNEDGYRTEYEVSFTDPLCEISPNPADLLLTETNRREANLCFVVCEPSGENSDLWPTRINEIVNIVGGHETELLEQIGHSDKEVNHVQYLTVTLKEEYPDVQFRHLQHGAPDEYAICTVDDDYEPEDGEDAEKEYVLRYEDGTIEHGKLHSPLSDGIDYKEAKNRDVYLSLKAPPIISLQETLMSLLTEQHGEVDEPREFNRDDFLNRFRDLCLVGPVGEQKDTVFNSRADELLEIAKKSGILIYGDSDDIHENRDFRAMYKQGNTTAGLKHSVKSKIFDSRIQNKKAEMAFETVEDQFQPRGGYESGVNDF